MIVPGLTSITFRSLNAEQIIELVSQAGLRAIEWGGDLHVPHGDTVVAARVRRQTEEAGLEMPSYGTYYRVGEDAWLRYVERAAKTGRTHYALMEFVRDQSREQFLQDAATLKQLVNAR